MPKVPSNTKVITFSWQKPSWHFASGRGQVLGCLKEPDNGQKISSWMKTVSFCWSEAWGLQWVWNGNQTWNTAPCNGLDQLHSHNVAGSHRSLCPGQQWLCKTLKIHWLSEVNFGGERMFQWKSLAGEAQLFLHVEICLCASGLTQRLWSVVPTASVATSKVSSVTLQKGLLNLNLGWFYTAGSELHLQVMSHTPGWCHTPQAHSSPCCLDYSSPNPASLMLVPLCPLWKGRLSPKNREEKAEPGADWFERVLTWHMEPCLAARFTLLGGWKWLPCRQSILPKSLNTGPTSGSSLRTSWP